MDNEQKQPADAVGSSEGLGVPPDPHDTAACWGHTPCACWPGTMCGRSAECAAEARRASQPPCQQCGAMTDDEAQTKCLGAAVDDCHGNQLWPDA